MTSTRSTAALALGLALVFGSAAGAPRPLQTTDTVVGKGKTATAGTTVTVHYTGWLYSPKQPHQHGAQFDSSTGGEPFTFTLGAGKVIPGWDQGLVGMKVGGKRTLIIPNHLAYGSRDMGPIIKAGSDLMFDVELVDVK